MSPTVRERSTQRGVALAAALIAATTGARAADTIRPGYWESVNRVNSPIQSTTIDRRCIAAKDIAKFLSCHINHHYQCVCPEQTAAGGQISFRGQCVDNKGQKVAISGHGAYTQTSLQMTADVTFKVLGIPIAANASTDARRIADVCPVASAP